MLNCLNSRLPPCPHRLTSWEQEAELEAVRSWFPRQGAEKPKLDPEACDRALQCVWRLLKGEAADVDGCPDIFISDPTSIVSGRFHWEIETGSQHFAVFAEIISS